MWVRGWETDIHAALGQALLMSRWRRWRFYPVCFILWYWYTHGKVVCELFRYFCTGMNEQVLPISIPILQKIQNVIEEEGKKGHISRFVEFIYTTRVTLFGLERWCYNFTIIIPLWWPSRPQNFPIIILMPPPKLISAPELNNEHDTSHRFIHY